MLQEDTISVIMGIRYRRNELDTLKRSIDSILDQSYSQFELLICERGSTTQAQQMLKEYANRDSRVKLIDGSNACSFSEQLNICIEHSSGNWIARMDDDDYSYPERFKRQIEYLKTHNDVAFVGCNVMLIQNGSNVGTQQFPEKPQVRDFLFNMPFIHPSLMFRRSSLDAVGGYSTLPICERCEDYDLLLRMYEFELFGANIQEFLFLYSLPHNGVTTRNFKDRTNEMRMRYSRFKRLGLLPHCFIYVIKPLAVWFLPPKLLACLKRRKYKNC